MIFRRRTRSLDAAFFVLVVALFSKGSKEHESTVAITARPMHVHTALLLLGANNGNPAMRRPIDEQKTRWMNVPLRLRPRVKPALKTGKNTRGVSFQLAVFEDSQAGSLRH